MKYFIFILFYVSCYFLYEPFKYAFGKYLTFSFLFIFPLFFFLLFKKSDFFVKFIISFLLFLYYYFFIYKFVLVVDGPIRFLGLIFSYIVIIFIHIPLLIYVLYCFSKVCGRVSKAFGFFSGALLGTCVVVLLLYPNYVTNKQIDQLCEEGKNDNFPKLPPASCTKIKCKYNIDSLKNEIIVKNDDLKNINSFSDFWILDNGQIIIYTSKDIQCSFAECFTQEYYLLDKENKKIEQTKKRILFQLYLPYTNHRHGSCN